MLWQLLPDANWLHHVILRLPDDQPVLHFLVAKVVCSVTRH
jgi:hypothetical protein